MNRAGDRITLDVESKLFAPIAFGSGYGGDSSWAHGTWKGGPFTERVSFDLTDPAVMARAPFSLIDHVGRAVCTEPDGSTREGAGLFEHGVIGPHHPSGFSDWTDVAD
jgi:hypothetical protein